MIYGLHMTTADQLPGTEATVLLGYKHRSSLTRLVQAGEISAVFKASGKRGEEFFNRSDVIALRDKLANRKSSPLSVTSVTGDGDISTSGGSA